MQYFGGKARIAKQLAGFIRPHIKPGQLYREPFVGGAWMMAAIAPEKGEASDACAPLIALYKALQQGWMPPVEVSEADYANAKVGNCEPHLQAFIGFGCSFGGKWFGGYARTKAGDAGARNYAQNAANSPHRKLHSLYKVNFSHADYRALLPQGEVVYCDPPYAGTTGYTAVGKFDWVEFWALMSEWSKANTVFVSSYEAPPEWSTVFQVSTYLDCRSKKVKKFALKSYCNYATRH